MTKRRSRGDGGLFWDERRQRWIASVTVGYDGRGNVTRSTDQLGHVIQDEECSGLVEGTKLG